MLDNIFTISRATKLGPSVGQCDSEEHVCVSTVLVQWQKQHVRLERGSQYAVHIGVSGELSEETQARLYSESWRSGAGAPAGWIKNLWAAAWALWVMRSRPTPTWEPLTAGDILVSPRTDFTDVHWLMGARLGVPVFTQLCAHAWANIPNS